MWLNTFRALLFLLIKDVPMLFLFNHTEFLMCSKKPLFEVGNGNLREMKAFIYLFNKYL